MVDGLLDKFHQGLLRRELFLGLVCGVDARQARVNLSKAEEPTGSHFESARYGRGEVGELVLIEGQQDIILGRLTAVQVPDSDRKAIGNHSFKSATLDATGSIQFLGTVRTDNLQVSAGVAHYPRLGDRVYAAPHPFVGEIPILMNQETDAEPPITLHVGWVSGSNAAPVQLRPEKLFGRHCAILGSTGGGKSWTVARLIEESAKYQSKIVLLDATGEYRQLPPDSAIHFHMGNPVTRAETSTHCSIPPEVFDESDFIAMFEPSGKVQGPRLREAIRSLRLLEIDSASGTDGVLKKVLSKKEPIEKLLKKHSAALEDPRAKFDPRKLARQLMEECVYPDGGTTSTPDATKWGKYSDSDKTFCLPLASRIHALVQSSAFAPVFTDAGTPLLECVERFLKSKTVRILRICLSGVSYEFRARQFIANAIGRMLLSQARAETFLRSPLLAVVDEAHNFLGHSVGHEEGAKHLDSFELIAREGRKYGLNLCLATQRPRDLTEGVLSQIGTLIVHRLTNDRDREIVVRACGEVDRSATAFLANLRQGEAAIIGVDFPIPLTIQIGRPAAPPKSEGPNYQAAWAGTVVT